MIRLSFLISFDPFKHWLKKIKEEPIENTDRVNAGRSKKDEHNTTWHLESLSPRLWQRQCDVMCGKAESSGRQEISSKSDLTVQSVFVWDVWMSTDRGMGVCDCVSACEKGGAFPRVPTASLTVWFEWRQTLKRTLRKVLQFCEMQVLSLPLNAVKPQGQSRTSSIIYLSSIRTGKAGGLLFKKKTKNKNSTLF